MSLLACGLASGFVVLIKLMERTGDIDREMTKQRALTETVKSDLRRESVKVEELKADVGTVKTDIETLKTNSTKSVNRIDNLESQMAWAQSDLKQLSKLVATATVSQATEGTEAAPSSINDAKSRQSGAQKAKSVDYNSNRSRSAPPQPALVTKAHSHLPNFNLPLVPGATVHLDSTGSPDYWFILHKTGEIQTFTRVQPFEATVATGTSPSTIRVHSIDDGFDYTIDRVTGVWVKN